jgi:hypothetical protein
MSTEVSAERLAGHIAACDDMASLSIHGHARPETWAKLASFLRELLQRREREAAMEWIPVSERLPPFNKYVLGYYCRGNWHDSRDDPNREVVMRIDTSMTDAGDPNNNNCGYKWSTFGPMRHFGADISHWCEIPALKDPP